MDYVLLVTMFLVGQAVAYWLGRRDERKTIMEFCDHIGLSDLMFQLNEEYRGSPCDCPECNKEKVKEDGK